MEELTRDGQITMMLKKHVERNTEEQTAQYTRIREDSGTKVETHNGRRGNTKIATKIDPRSNRDITTTGGIAVSTAVTRNRTGHVAITNPTTDTKDGDRGPMLRLTLDPHHLVPAKSTNTETAHTPPNMPHETTNPNTNLQAGLARPSGAPLPQHPIQTLSKPSSVPSHRPRRPKFVLAVVARITRMQWAWTRASLPDTILP
jgi:hypothetical protein